VSNIHIRPQVNKVSTSRWAIIHSRSGFINERSRSIAHHRPGFYNSSNFRSKKCKRVKPGTRHMIWTVKVSTWPRRKWLTNNWLISILQSGESWWSGDGDPPDPLNLPQLCRALHKVFLQILWSQSYKVNLLPPTSASLSNPTSERPSCVFDKKSLTEPVYTSSTLRLQPRPPAGRQGGIVGWYDSKPNHDNL